VGLVLVPAVTGDSKTDLVAAVAAVVLVGRFAVSCHSCWDSFDLFPLLEWRSIGDWDFVASWNGTVADVAVLTPPPYVSFSRCGTFAEIVWVVVFALPFKYLNFLKI